MKVRAGDVYLIKINKIYDVDSAVDMQDDKLTYVGVYDDSNLLETASYFFTETSMKIVTFTYNKKDLTIADALIKTLIFYADLSKKRYIEFESDNVEIAVALGFNIVDNKYIYDLYNQKNKCCSCSREEV